MSAPSTIWYSYLLQLQKAANMGFFGDKVLPAGINIITIVEDDSSEEKSFHYIELTTKIPIDSPETQLFLENFSLPGSIPGSVNGALVVHYPNSCILTLCHRAAKYVQETTDYVSGYLEEELSKTPNPYLKL